MGRTTTYNVGVASDEKYALVSAENKELLEDFLKYCKSSNKSPQTIYQYERQLHLFFVWNQEQNKNKFFTDLKKRDFVNFFTYLSEDLKASAGRVVSLRGVLSSLSAYIETILDDEYPDFKNLVKSLQLTSRIPAREKTVLGDDEIERILCELVKTKKYQLACFLALLASSGMRRSEVIQIEVSCFTENPKIVFGCLYETNKIRTKGRGKEGKVISRLVFKDLFDPYLELWLNERKEKGITAPTLFVRPRGGEYLPASRATITSFAERINKYSSEAFYPHCMRHYFVTSLKKRGYPDDIIQKMVKWSSIAMVSIYNDLGDEEELSAFFGKVETVDIVLKQQETKSSAENVQEYLELQKQEEERRAAEKREEKKLYRRQKRAQKEDEKGE